MMHLLEHISSTDVAAVVRTPGFSLPDRIVVGTAPIQGPSAGGRGTENDAARG